MANSSFERLRDLLISSPGSVFPLKPRARFTLLKAVPRFMLGKATPPNAHLHLRIYINTSFHWNFCRKSLNSFDLYLLTRCYERLSCCVVHCSWFCWFFHLHTLFVTNVGRYSLGCSCYFDNNTYSAASAPLTYTSRNILSSTCHTLP